MKISRLEIANVIGIARAEVDMPTPVTVFSGPNGVGKSSIAEALSLAFTAQPRRVKLKKELSALLHDGAPKGRVSISFDDGQGEGAQSAEFRLPKGEQSADAVTGAAFLPYVLDAHLFSTLSEDERRTMLFTLTGCKTSGKVVMDKLVNDYGVSQEMAADFAPMLKGGFESAAKAAYNWAKDAKAVWKSITHEQWGSEKAPGWKPAHPESAAPSAAEMDARLKAHEKLQADIDNGKNHIATQTALQGASISHSERLRAAQETAELLERRRTKLKTTQKDLDAFNKKIPALTEKVAELRSWGEPIKCPCCDAELRIVAGVLEKFTGLKDGAKALADTALELTNAREAVRKLEAVKANDLRDIAASEAAIDQAKAIQAEDVVKVDEEHLDKCHVKLADLIAKEKTLRAEFNGLQDLKNAHESLVLTEKKAADEHAKVVAWLAMGDALSPDGIPASLLADAMAPVNQSLKVLSGLSGWESVEIQADMGITYGPRPYGLRSESEQWRADALLALAIAQISGLKMVVLDRFDVLDAPSRIQLMKMLIQLGELGAMETMIIAGTMKEPMKASKNYTAVWVANSIVENAA